MTDTVRIERPLFCRRFEDRGGRVKADAPMDLPKIRTRIEDARELSRIWPRDSVVDMSPMPVTFTTAADMAAAAGPSAKGS